MNFIDKINKTAARICAVVLSFLTMLSVTASVSMFHFEKIVNAALNTPNSVIVDSGGGETVKYERHYTDEALATAGLNADVEIAREGTVLLKNVESALPLKKDERVSFFGIGANDILTAGTGSGAGAAGVSDTNLKAALEANGITVNNDLYSWYAANKPAKYRGIFSNPVSGTNSGAMITEVPISSVNLSSVANTDIGIFVLTRQGGEGADSQINGLPSQDFEHYLELNEDEKAVLAKMKELTKKQIVIINSNSAVGLGFMNKAEYGVDACVWMPGTGTSGIKGVADVLTGKVSPSGKTVDTWSASSLSAPAMMNVDLMQWTNYKDVIEKTGSSATIGMDWKYFWNDAYCVELEGIYVGYKYYETRYEDCILGQGNANGSAGVYVSSGNKWNYDEEVSVPFGFGLSYTTFTQTLDKIEEGTEKATGEKCYTLTVTVKNTGNMAGKSVIEVYAQQPYDASKKVEKSSIVFVGTEKTKELKPNETETVKVTVLKRDLASYDYLTAKSYVFDSGKYYFAIGDDAHDAMKNILEKKGKKVGGNAAKVIEKSLGEDNSFKKSITGKVITNKFEYADINYYYDNIKYLTRSDWQNTYPSSQVLTATEKVINALKLRTYYEPKTDEENKIKAKYPDYLNGSGKGINLISMRGADFDDTVWEDVLNCITLEELILLNTDGYPGTKEVKSITKPGNIAMDGPSGHNANMSKDKQPGHAFPVQVMVGATWNKALAARLGELLAEEGFKLGKQGILGPGANIHRTPYSGRNFEYYSEDGVLAGLLLESEIKAYVAVGGEMYVKHFALNDQEDHRFGLATFANEQGMREIYLKAFEYAFVRGKCNAVMTSFNRIGCKFASASKELVTDVLRGEWGFTGIITTDNAIKMCGYMEPIESKIAGTCTWRNGFNELILPVYQKYAGTDLALYEAMRSCAKYVLYTSANGINMDGMSKSSKVVSLIPYWKPLIISVTVVIGLLAIGAIALMLIGDKLRKEA